MEKTIVIGLTGNIASGKSHIAEIFKSLGALVRNSDIAAHEIMNGEAFKQVAAAFPNAIIDGKIDRKKLGAEVFADDEKLKKLEAILHPLVRQSNLDFIAANPGKIIVLEIPLLLETKAETICNYVVFVHVSRETLEKRALARSGMTLEKLEEILKRQTQIPVEEKIRRADFVIENDPGKNALAQVEAILDKVK